MRYQLTDEAADPRTLLGARQEPHHLAEVQGAASDPARAVLQDFVNAFSPRRLAELKACTDREVGFGIELVSTMYDDDLDPGDEPFTGVLISAHYRDDEVVLSRAAYARLVDAMLALAPKG